MTAPVEARLWIYTRRDCSLCLTMEQGVRAIAGDGVPLEMVEIDDDPALCRRFGADVPVLCCGDEVLCRHFLDVDRLRAALAANG